MPWCDRCKEDVWLVVAAKWDEDTKKFPPYRGPTKDGYLCRACLKDV